MLCDVTVHDVERIVQSVITAYGLRMRLYEVARQTDSWHVMLGPEQGAMRGIVIAAASPHDLRRAVMNALNVEE
jgi:hypothetical protein